MPTTIVNILISLLNLVFLFAPICIIVISLYYRFNVKIWSALYAFYIISYLIELFAVTKFQLLPLSSHPVLFFLISMVIFLICLIIHISIYIGRKRMEKE